MIVTLFQFFVKGGQDSAHLLSLEDKNYSQKKCGNQWVCNLKFVDIIIYFSLAIGYNNNNN